MRLQPHSHAAPRSMTRATPRPTPGVIRRRIRDPSPSPPESPQTSSDVYIATGNKQTSIPPPPPFIPSSVSIGNDKDEVIPTPSIPPPAPDTGTSKDYNSSGGYFEHNGKDGFVPVSSKLSNVPSTTEIDDRNTKLADLNELHGEMAKESAKRVKYKTPVASIPHHPLIMSHLSLINTRHQDKPIPIVQSQRL